MARSAKRCRACESPIRFLQMEHSGKWSPVDARPSSLRGNILIVDGSVGRLLSTSDARHHRREGFDLYVSHWASCPGARNAQVDRARDVRGAAGVRSGARALFAVGARQRADERQERLFPMNALVTPGDTPPADLPVPPTTRGS